MKAAETKERRRAKLNEQNIIPHAFKKGETTDKAANGRKGGIASGVAKRQKKDLADLLEQFLNFKVKSPEAIAQLQTLGFTEEECTNRAAFMMNMQKFASKGNSAYTKMLVELEQSQKTKKAEMKRLKLENEKLEQEIARMKLENEAMKAKLDGKNDVEDLTPLAALLQDMDDEATIEQEVKEDGD